ncbi:hypothetical protein [Ralstonia phage RSY1]|uniref:Uncharacterized protein n=1 Tax=Ralstonia phage RSY1 TaxID=1530085 RepID=A0A077K9Q4_9CAUD|nr:hypothetical protein MA18_gp01 [Ralstonia phage RSY1]BAP28102.1 hypothetical protein [Ralstonia phage RSY1]
MRRCPCLYPVPGTRRRLSLAAQAGEAPTGAAYWCICCELLTKWAPRGSALQIGTKVPLRGFSRMVKLRADNKEGEFPIIRKVFNLSPGLIFRLLNIAH